MKVKHQNMKAIHAYLTFSGNCRDAMQFYQKCIGGKLNMQLIGDTPQSEKMPEKMKNCILTATLCNRNFMLIGSDIVSDEGLLKGNAVSLTLICSNEEELRTCYHSLSQGGIQTHPVKETYWGSLFGTLTDKYENYWLLHLEPNGKFQNIEINSIQF